MKNQLSLFGLLAIALLLNLSSCEKENFDTVTTTFEENEIPVVELPGDAFLGFAFTRPIAGGGFSVFGGSTNNATITMEEVDGIPTYTISSFVEDGILVTQEVVFQTDLTLAGDYPITSIEFTTPDQVFFYSPDEILGDITISDLSGSLNHVEGSINSTLVAPNNEEHSYSSNFQFVPFQ